MEVLCDVRAVLGESPRWDDRTHALHWLDVDTGLVFAMELSSQAAWRRWELPAPVGALAPHEDGGLACAVGGTWCRPDTPWTGVRLAAEGMRFNDAGVAPDGTLWSATVRCDGDLRVPGRGALYRVGDRVLDPQLGGLVAGNGIGWSPDGRWMYLVDGGPRVVLRSRYEAGAGPVGGWSCWASFHAGMPDGIAVDAAGGVWVAVRGTGEVVRLDPDGVPTHRLRAPTPSVTAVCLAGPELDLLVVTTSAQRVPVQEDPLAGLLYAAPAPVPGLLPRRATWRATWRAAAAGGAGAGLGS